jgi:hypothetical protein
MRLAAIASSLNLVESILAAGEGINQAGRAKVVGPDAPVDIHRDLDINVLYGIIHPFGENVVGPIERLLAAGSLPRVLILQLVAYSHWLPSCP